VAGGICCIEWADKILPYLPAHTQFLHLSHLSVQERVIQ
jgi:tRNA A37 threonylcarbamoyladenosine biosynthesis protein TsaE